MAPSAANNNNNSIIATTLLRSGIKNVSFFYFFFFFISYIKNCFLFPIFSNFYFLFPYLFIFLFYFFLFFSISIFYFLTSMGEVPEIETLLYVSYLMLWVGVCVCIQGSKMLRVGVCIFSQMRSFSQKRNLKLGNQSTLKMREFFYFFSC